MTSRHPKSVRRRMLTILYDRYMKDPLDMLSPEDLLEDGTLSRGDLVPNAYYLGDRGYVELMIGYSPPMFAAARITANGIDLVENQFEFNLRFPGTPDEMEEGMADLPLLVERLVEEADFSPLDGEARRCLLRDVQYLREEFSRPVSCWRRHVIWTVMGWIGAACENADEALPSLAKIRSRVAQDGVIS